MITLDEHNARRPRIMNQSNEPTPNGIACPDCGKELQDSNPMMVLASNPPQKAINCPSCGYHGFRLA